MKKAMFLNSGGLDSLAVAIMLSSQGWELHSLFVDVGQYNVNSAKVASKKIADKYCASHTDLKIDGSWIVDSPNAPSRVAIPYQNAFLYFLGYMYCRKNNIEYLASGIRGFVDIDFDDKFITFVKTLQTAPSIVIPVRPLKDMEDFKEVYSIIKDNELLKHTVSCSLAQPCGVCTKCVYRKEHAID